MPLDNHTASIKRLLEKAADKILDIYEKRDYRTDLKPDQSPVTTADLISEEIISSALSKLFPDTPVIGEERADLFSPDAILPDTYWIVDPIDGTKEFIKGNGEFCICLAKISNGEVTEGYIYAPVSSVFWYANIGEGAYKVTGGEPVRLPLGKSPKKITILKSRSHSDFRDEKWIGEVSSLFPTDKEYQGSAIKFCRIAEGSGDIYIKFGVINRWDVAAGALLVEESGGAVNSLISAKKLLFNSPGFSVEPFLVTSHRLEKESVKKLLGLSSLYRNP